MSDSAKKYIPELIRECDEMLSLLRSNESHLLSCEKKNSIIMEISGTKEYLNLLWEIENAKE